VRQFYGGTDRRRPALTLERDGEPPVSGLFMTIVTNRSPWTYVRDRPLLPVPNPDFNSGLDLLALRQIRVTTICNAVGQMLYVRSRPPRGRNLLSVLGSESLTLRSARPIAFQADGEYLGETEAVKFQFVPHALRIVALLRGLPGAGTGLADTPKAKCDRSDIKFRATVAVPSCARQPTLRGFT
jgi:hypothetical protein